MPTKLQLPPFSKWFSTFVEYMYVSKSNVVFIFFFYNLIDTGRIHELGIGNKIMLKQASRNQRSKGLKVKAKHGLHTCLLLAICIWLIYQVKQSYNKNAALDVSSNQMSKEVQSGHEVLKLGRKDLNPLIDVGISSKFENGSHEDTVEEESILSENERERTDSGDDEIDEHDDEKVEEEEEPEQLEDFIDEEDDNKEENAVLLNNRDHGGIELKSGDELYKGDHGTASGGIDDSYQIITDENK